MGAAMRCMISLPVPAPRQWETKHWPVERKRPQLMPDLPHWVAPPQPAVPTKTRVQR